MSEALISGGIVAGLIGIVYAIQNRRIRKVEKESMSRTLCLERSDNMEALINRVEKRLDKGDDEFKTVTKLIGEHGQLLVGIKTEIKGLCREIEKLGRLRNIHDETG